MCSDDLALTPSTGTMPIPKRDVDVAGTSTPPFCTKLCRCATPSQPSPGRMSSVESFLPTRFGVSGVFFHGSGLPQAAGRPFTIAVGDEEYPTGGKRMTSYFA